MECEAPLPDVIRYQWQLDGCLADTYHPSWTTEGDFQPRNEATLLNGFGVYFDGVSVQSSSNW